MIPILYESNETQFTSNGIGPLSDALECTVTEERNGEYICELVYPVDGKRFDDIQEGRIIGAWHDDNHDIQPFDIYGRSAPIDGKVTFYASHISYRLNSIVLLPQPYDTCAAAIAGIVQDSVGENPFSFYTNKNVTAHYQREVPISVRSCLGGEENSILDVFGGGEYEFDKWNVRLLTRRGSDTDVEIRYGKNLTDFEQELDFSDAVNGIMPYWYGTRKLMGVDVKVAFWLPERVLYKSGVTPVDGRNKVIPYDFSDKFEEMPTETQLRTTAQAWLDSSDIWLPSNSIKVDFVRLSDTEEYKDVAPLQQVKLCDTVLVTFPKYNIEKLRIKIVKTVYNVLAERYDEMELGDPPQTFADSITAKVSESVVDLQNEVDGIRRNQFVRAVTEYARSSSPSTFTPTTTWSESLPSYVAGEYYWQRTASYYNDGSVYYSDPIYSFVAQASGEANAAADNAHAAATEAERIAQSALDGVSEVEQHFWYDSTGAHIAENAGDLTTGASQTIASTGTVMMRNGKLVTSWTGRDPQTAALNFYDCSSGDIRQDSNGNYIYQSGNLVASYARSGITFYVYNSRVMALTGSALSFYDPSDTSDTDPMAVYSNGGIQLGKTGSSTSGKFNINIDPSNGILFRQYTADLFKIGLTSDTTPQPQISTSKELTLYGEKGIHFLGSGTTAFLTKMAGDTVGSFTVQGRMYSEYILGNSTYNREVLNRGNVCSGVTSSVSVPANSYLDVPIGCGPFAVNPGVVVSLYSTSKDYQLGNVTAAVTSISSSSFTVRIFNATSVSRTPAISWIAVDGTHQ